MASYQNGGWYNNPATGKNQRWWNGGIWTDGSDPTQSSGGGGNNSDIQNAINSVPKGPNWADFNFDWNAAEAAAMTKLAPYYKQMLDLNNGDVERAKQAIEADYASGKRLRTSQYTGDVQNENATAKTEMNNENDNLNGRGVLFAETAPGQQADAPQASGTDETTTAPEAAASGASFSNPTTPSPQQGLGITSLATKSFYDPLLDSQQARRNAIQRAITNQSTDATTKYTKDLGDNTSKGLSTDLQLNQEKSDKAMQTAESAYTVARNQFEAGTVNNAVNPYLQTS